ncbi:MAG: hypothetical protein ACRENO_00795 [Thermodesulfobacteriota bacterium]
MRKTLIFTALLLISTVFINIQSSFAVEEKYKVVIEESFYVVKPENEDLFLETYKTRLFPFWQEMKKMGIIVEDFRMYSQRVHTAKPHWTYKTIVKFKNYAAIDKWLEIRDKVYAKLFPGEKEYKEPGKIINSITEEHWDEFIREIPLDK